MAALLNLRTNYLLRSDLKDFPAENVGTVLAAILIALPVCGLRPFLAALFLEAKVPNPTKVTLSPFLTVFWIDSIVADKIKDASFLDTFAFFEISEINSSLFMINPLSYLPLHYTHY